MTFSITARCARTGQLGVAVSTAVPAVGWWVPYVEPRAGAVASQALCNPYLGVIGLKLLRDGASADQTLNRLMAADPLPQRRQLAIVDAQGRCRWVHRQRNPPVAGPPPRPGLRRRWQHPGRA